MGRTSEAKEKLIEAANQLIWEDSYHSVGVSEICKKAEVKPGSFYYFFPSKQELAIAAMEYHWQQAKGGLLSPAFHKEIPPLERITKLFEKAYLFHSSQQEEGHRVRGCALGSFIGEMGEKDEPVRKRIECIFSELASHFVEAIDEAIEAGQLIPMEDEAKEELADALLSFFEGVSLIAKARNDSEIFRKMALQITAFFEKYRPR